MLSFRVLLLRHGYAFLFCYIFAVQAGVPVPADPLLLLMGALSGDRHYTLWVSLLLAILAALSGDCVWYELGRRRGRSVLGLLCKISLEPDTCVRKTEAAFTRRGAGSLLFAKFIPGMSLVSVPLAGATRMPRWRFLLADALGCTIWTASYLAAGFLFHTQVDSLIGQLGLFGRRAGVVVLSLLALYIAWKYVQRWRLRREMRINRITPQTAFHLISSAAPPTIVDLRHPSEVEREGLKIPGAILLHPDQLRSRSHELSREEEIILYCT